MPFDSDSPVPHLRSFLVYLATERGLADNTLLAYRRDLEDLGRFVANPAHLPDAAVDELRDYLRDQSIKGQSTRTVTRRIAAIESYFHFLHFIGVVDRRDDVEQLDRPKPSQDLPTVLSKAQVAQLIAAPDPGARLFTRDVAILELLYASGLRATELCQLKLRDLNLQERCVRVFGKGAKERVVPLGHVAKAAIERYVAELRPTLLRKPTDLVFLSRTGKPFERVALWMLVEKYGRESGLLKSVSPHTLRHCFATHLLSGGADLRVVQELLGHADVGTTQIYTHVDATRLKSIHQKFHPRG